jgi:hypothetical protein
VYNNIYYLLSAMVGTTSLAVSFGLAPFLVAFCRSAHHRIESHKESIEKSGTDRKRLIKTDRGKRPNKTLSKIIENTEFFEEKKCKNG